MFVLMHLLLCCASCSFNCCKFQDQPHRLIYVGVKKEPIISDLTNHLMGNSRETTIALASMTYIVDLDAFKLHTGG